MKNKFIKLWKNSNEYTKCAIYLMCCQEEQKKIKKKIIVYYEDLIKDPLFISKKIFKKLNLTKTKKTLEIIKSIKAQNNHNDVDIKSIKKNLSIKIIKKIEKYYKELN